MSNLKRFKYELKENDALKDKIMNSGSEEETLKIAHDAGYDLKKEEIRSINECMLENVAGGNDVSITNNNVHDYNGNLLYTMETTIVTTNNGEEISRETKYIFPEKR